MKSLQKLLKENRTDQVKEAKQKFEVCQRLLEQGIRQASRGEIEAVDYPDDQVKRDERVERYKQQNLQLLALIDRLKEGHFESFP